MRPGIDFHGTDEALHGRQQFSGHITDSPVGREGDAPETPVAVLDDRLVGS